MIPDFCRVHTPHSLLHFEPPQGIVWQAAETMKLPAHRAGLPGNVDMIIGSAFLPAYTAGLPADLPVILYRLLKKGQMQGPRNPKE